MLRVCTSANYLQVSTLFVVMIFLIMPELHLNQVQEKIKAMQFEFPQNDCTENFLELASWLEDCGGFVSPALFCSMSMRSGTLLRGISTSKDLTTLEPVLRVPLSCCITGNTTEQVIVNLADEMAKEHSRYSPYLSGLPSLATFKEFHLYFAEERLKHDYEFLGIGEFVDSQRDIVASMCMSKTEHECTFITEAFLNFRTRAFSLPAMVPLLDMINTAVLDDINVLEIFDGDGWTVRALRPIQAYSELNQMYFDADNRVLASQFGFMLHDNPCPLSSSSACNHLVADQQASSAQENLLQRLTAEACFTSSKLHADSWLGCRNVSHW